MTAFSHFPGRIRRAVVAALTVMAAGAGVSAIAASAAEAYPYSNVYVSFPTWLGNCPAGGSVTGIYAANGNLWVTPASGDWGDDLIYPRVNLFAGNAVSARLFCSRPWYRGGNYWGPTVSATIRPTRGGQTFWVGPGGQRHN